MDKLLLSLLVLFSFTANAQVKNLKRIAFGSCNSQYDAQPLWADIVNQKPDLWVWLGDSVYGDWKSLADLKEAFERQNENREFKKFKAAGIPVIGTWDDHDYGYDNADGTLSYKKESQKLFLDFLGEPHDSPRRQQEGIYYSYDYMSDGHKVKFIMLDNRYFKDTEPGAWMLGEKQWQWLEEELKNSDADLHFISTGLSIHSPLIRYTEEWPEYPAEFDRLHGLLNKYNPKGRVFLTGDKHFSSIFMRWGELEFMSSGMTHVADRRTWWYLGRLYNTTWFGLGYGQIDIDWEGDTPILHLSIRTTNRGDIHLSKFKWEGDHWNWIYKKQSDGIDEREQECCNFLLTNKENPCEYSPSGSCSSRSRSSLAPTLPVNMLPAAPSRETVQVPMTSR